MKDSGTDYSGAGNRDISLLGKEIILASYPSGNPSNCIIHCGGSETNPHRGFYFDDGESQNVLIDGFTITGGFLVNDVGPGSTDRGAAIFCYASSPTISNCVISGNEVLNDSAYEVPGGAIALYNSSAIIVGNAISNNDGETNALDSNLGVAGGAIWCGGSSSAPVIQSNSVSYNTAGRGGGICAIDGSSPVIVNNSICHNSADTSGGGLFLHAVVTTVVISTNDIQYNSSVSYGGGIYIEDCGPRVVGNRISNNSSAAGGGLFVSIRNTGIEPPDVWFDIISMNSACIGGGMYVINSDLTSVLKPTMFVTNSVMADNANDGDSSPVGSAIYVVNHPNATSQRVVIDSCTIANNAGLAVHFSSPSLINNSVLWGNDLDYSNASVTNSCFKGAIGGTSLGNINSFPYLKIDGSYALESFSPCIDAGNPFTVVGADQEDIYGNNRLVGAAIDMGAVESATKSNIQTGGLPDDWLSLYSLTGEDAAPDADPDSDGLSNIEEYRDGTDPTQGTPAYDVYVDTRTNVSPETGTIEAPFNTLHEAITAARSGAAIRVAQGTYSEAVTVAGKSLYILGGYQGWDEGTSTEVFEDEDRNYSTIIDASAATGSPVFSFVQCFDASLDGFTIQNGSGDKGGGVCSIDSYVSISNNIVLSNSATLGGGIYCEGMGINYPYIRGNIIHDNEATSGGGIYATGTSPRIHNNTIYSNTAEATGGGISCSSSTPSIYNNLIGKSSLMSDPSNHPNEAELGGGIYLFMCSGGTDGNYIGTNAVDGNAAWGGNLITGNIASAGGGGICLHCCTGIQIGSNVIAENQASEGGGIFILSSPVTLIKNNTVANNISQ